MNKGKPVALTDANLNAIVSRAKEIIRLDKKYAWREAISICNYSVFEDGVNLVPGLVKEIRRLKARVASAEQALEACSDFAAFVELDPNYDGRDSESYAAVEVAKLNISAYYTAYPQMISETNPS